MQFGQGIKLPDAGVRILPEAIANDSRLARERTVGDSKCTDESFIGKGPLMKENFDVYARRIEK